PEHSTLSLHDALPIFRQGALDLIAKLHDSEDGEASIVTWPWDIFFTGLGFLQPTVSVASAPVTLHSEVVALESLRNGAQYPTALDRKSTRLNSSHVKI